MDNRRKDDIIACMVTVQNGGTYSEIQKERV